MDKPDQHDPTVMGSERSFGIVFTAFFLIVTAVRWYRHGSFDIWLAALAAVFLVLTFAAPHVLRPLNVVWFRFGLLLNRVTSPLVIGAIFLFAVLPTGLVLRLMDKRPMRLNFGSKSKRADSYWQQRDPPGPRREMMINQY